MRKRKILAVFLIVFTVMLSSFTFYGYQMVYTPNVNIDTEEDIILSIAKGTTFKELQNQLYETRIVNDLISFSFLSKVFGYHKQVQPGHYTLRPNMTNVEFIRFLKVGNPPVRVAFHNVRRLDNLSAIFAKHLEFDSAEMSQYFNRGDIQSNYGMDRANLIGMFLPDTYEFFYKASPRQVMDKMKAVYDEFWTQSREQKAKNLGLTPQEIITIASIVKAETAQVDEASKIAGVYKNRLEIGMRLQADPTLIFAQDDYSIRRVRKGDRDVDSPYNTYKYGGLPPGPINMVTPAYIDAVLSLEEHEYLYFCAKSDFSGYHVFSKSFDDHLKNARKFQQALNLREIYR